MQVLAPRLLGRVFTPAPVARRLARRTLAGLDGELHVLDPACGEGALLAAAREEAGERVALEGWDKDARTLARARAALPDARLVRRDALASRSRGRFDAVLANPPWVSFSGREHVAIPPAEKARLRERFESFAGWPSLQGPFLERALDLVRPGGRVGFVLPRQVLELERYAPLRRVVAAKARVLEVEDLGESVFEGVCEPAATVVLEAGEGAPGASWRAPLPLARWAARTLERLARFPRFPRELVSDPGVHTGNAARVVLSEKKRRGFVPCREGKDVHPFSLGAPRIFVARSPELEPPLYARVAAASRYAQVDILVRQTADRPIAARHEPRAHFRNSALAVTGGPFALELLLALLNSRLFALAHRAGQADARQRAFPQVKVGAIAALPFVPRAPGTLVALVRLRERGAPVEAALERAVCRLFGIDDDALSALLRWSP